MSYLSKAIKSLHPEAEFSFTDEDYSTIVWDVLDGEAPSATEIAKAIEKVKANEIALIESKAQAKADLLARLGITEEEAALLLA